MKANHKEIIATRIVKLICSWNKMRQRIEYSINLPQVTDKHYYILLYQVHLAMSRI